MTKDKPKTNPELINYLKNTKGIYFTSRTDLQVLAIIMDIKATAISENHPNRFHSQGLMNYLQFMILILI